MERRASKEVRGFRHFHLNGREMLSTTEDGRRWTDWCTEVGLSDVYWSWDHLALWAREWGARPLGVRWTEAGETILHPVLLVSLDRLEGGEGLFDVRTAYDFGGPRHAGAQPAAAMASFEIEWTEWSRSHGVVTEFLRLHPTALTERPSSASFHADHHIVDLSRPYDQIRAGYRASWRSPLRQAEASGSTVDVADAPDQESVDSFVGMYARTMDRVGAAFLFRFRDETLRGLLALPDVRLVTVRNPAGEPAAHAVVLASGPTLFYHLSCSDPSQLALRPNHLLLDTVVRVGGERGFDAFHLGGGAPSLARFKAGMGGGTVPYFVVRRVADAEVYDALCRANGGMPQGPDFPAYIRRFEE